MNITKKMWQINGNQLEFVQFDNTIQNVQGGLFLMGKEEWNKTKDQMTLRMEVSDDQKYCAIIYPQIHIVKIFERKYWEKRSGPPKTPEETYYYPEFITILHRNTYYATETNFIFSFIQHPVTNETLCLFNQKHGELAVLKPSGELVFSDYNNDKFISQLVWINKSYFALKVWHWHPWSAFMLYNVADFLNGPGYKSKVIIGDDLANDDFAFDFGEKFKKVISIKDNKILFHGFEFDPEDFEQNFKQINFDIQHRRYLRDLETYGNQQSGCSSDINWSAVRLDNGCWSAVIHLEHNEFVNIFFTPVFIF